jgi:hypothetical protein
MTMKMRKKEVERILKEKEKGNSEDSDNEEGEAE